jgi:hypothetical protein
VITFKEFLAEANLEYYSELPQSPLSQYAIKILKVDIADELGYPSNAVAIRTFQQSNDTFLMEIKITIGKDDDEELVQAVAKKLIFDLLDLRFKDVDLTSGKVTVIGNKTSITYYAKLALND